MPFTTQFFLSEKWKYYKPLWFQFTRGFIITTSGRFNMAVQSLKEKPWRASYAIKCNFMRGKKKSCTNYMTAWFSCVELQCGVILTMYFSYIRKWKWVEMHEINLHDTYKWKELQREHLTPERINARWLRNTVTLY